MERLTDNQGERERGERIFPTELLLMNPQRLVPPGETAWRSLGTILSRGNEEIVTVN